LIKLFVLKRVWWNRIIEIKEWDPVWKDLIIIDDLIQTWGTIIEASEKLKSLWAKSVSAFASHWVFPDNSHEKLAKWLDKLIVSDSIPENNKRKLDNENMEILKIKNLVKKIILD
jgi:phosphoribosylpyrophosphate synthetase